MASSVAYTRSEIENSRANSNFVCDEFFHRILSRRRDRGSLTKKNSSLFTRRSLHCDEKTSLTLYKVAKCLHQSADRATKFRSHRVNNKSFCYQSNKTVFLRLNELCQDGCRRRRRAHRVSGFNSNSIDATKNWINSHDKPSRLIKNASTSRTLRGRKN